MEVFVCLFDYASVQEIVEICEHIALVVVGNV